jgi:hypothetical protein
MLRILKIHYTKTAGGAPQGGRREREKKKLRLANQVK